MPCTSITERKRALRAQVKETLAALPPTHRAAQDKALFRAFLGLDAVKKAETILLFWGTGTEPSTAELVSALLASGKQVALPHCLPAGELEARLYRGTRLIKNRYGIPEPGPDCPFLPKSEVQLTLTPALCYDRQGYRLGRGGGYYDRWLSNYTGTSVGLCYREVLQKEVPRAPHDRPVNILLTVTE